MHFSPIPLTNLVILYKKYTAVVPIGSCSNESFNQSIVRLTKLLKMVTR